MKKAVLIWIGLMLMIPELAVTNKFVIFGAGLNLFFVYAIVLAVNVDTKTNYICVGILAFIYDLLISRYFGIHLVIFLLLTALTRLVIDKLYEEKVWSLIVVLLLSTALYISYLFGVNQLLFVPEGISVFLDRLWRAMILNAFCGVILNAMLRPVSKHIMKNWW